MKKKSLIERHRVLANMPMLMLLFLIREKALTKFMNNCDKFMTKDDTDVILIKKQCNISIKFYDYFFWSKTPEGADYWADLSARYWIYAKAKGIRI